MSYKSAEWIKQTNTKRITSGLNDFGGNLQKTAENLKLVVSEIDNAMQLVERFLQTYVDPVAPFLAKIKTFFSTILNDILGIGGGAILITPFNRMRKRYIPYRSSGSLLTGKYKFNEVHLTTDATKSFYVTVPPINLPAMTPAEAFVELQNSFSNKNDPFRPRWTTNTTTMGFGVLIAMDDVDNVAPFLKSMESFANFFNFSDVKESIDKYRNQFSTYTKDLDESMYKAMAQNLRGQGIISDVTETTYVSEKGKIRKKLQASKFKIQEELPSLHWYGLSVENIPGLRAFVEAYTAFMDWLIQITQDVDSAIWELFNIIKKRVYTLIDLVENVVEALASFFMLFQIGDMYTFTIEAEAGGVQHILSAIQQSIQSPSTEAATDISKMWTTADLSILFFAGAGSPNVEAWNLLFNSLFPPEDTSTDTESLVYTCTGIVDKAIYPLNRSYYVEFVTENNDLYFTYSVKKDDGTVVNQWTDYTTNKLRGNIKTSEFIIAEEGAYTLSFAARYDNMETDPETIEYHFQTSSLIDKPITSPQNEAPITIPLSTDFSGTVSLAGSETGRIIDRSRVYGGGETQLGQVLNDSGLYTLNIESTSGSKISTYLAIDSRYPLIEMNTLQSTIYLASLPSIVKFTDFAEVFMIYINGEWITITCPGYVTFTEYGTYPVKYFKDGVWRNASVQTSATDTSFKDICG